MIKQGDIVSFLNEIGGGKILSIKGKIAQILTDEGFEIPYPIEELVLRKDIFETKSKSVSSPDEQNHLKEKIHRAIIDNIEKIDFQKVVSQKEKKSTAKKTKIIRRDEKWEIDLHIEELLDDTRGMSSGDKLIYQISHIKNKMEQAIQKKISKVVFIHGKGAGVLKAELYSILKKYPNVSFYDASYRDYGTGATEVIIRNFDKF